MNNRVGAMHLQDLANRFVEYKRRHGMRSALRRAFLSVRRILAGNRMVLFYCDLNSWKSSAPDAGNPLTVERITGKQTVAARDLMQIVNFWNPQIMQRLITERFARGAALWLAKSGSELAGYGWTLNGSTIEPYFFPLEPEDVHLFDFFVFPEYRGQRVNRSLVLKILEMLAAERKGHAYIEVAEWNTSQLKSLSRMPFQKLGCARKFRVFGRTLTMWSEGRPPGQHSFSKATVSNASA